MGSESIAHEAEGRMGYWLRGHEGEKQTLRQTSAKQAPNLVEIFTFPGWSISDIVPS